MKLYGLRNKKTNLPMCIESSTNECDDCGSHTQYYLEEFDSYKPCVWLVKDRQLVQDLLDHVGDRHWLDQHYNTPKWYVKPKEKIAYTIFEVEI